MSPASEAGGSLLEALKSGHSLLSVELRPPRANRPGPQSMDDWIDTYHSIQRLTRSGNFVFITDNAVGQQEEENLRHLVTNLGPDAVRHRIVPFLTCKHTLDYCLRYAARAFEFGFRTLVVLGGDRHDRIPRCVEHAWELRERIRRTVPDLALGGWGNPHGDPDQQAEYLAQERGRPDFFLTQVVSHHSLESVGRFRQALDRRKVEIPGVFGVFYYRSARRRTLKTLQQFFPVPADALVREFDEEKGSPEAICARSISGLRGIGVSSIYISNLPVADAPARLERIGRL